MEEEFPRTGTYTQWKFKPLATVNHGVSVRPSRIPGAGMGLFADHDFPKGSLITQFDGVEVPSKQASELRNQGKATHSLTLTPMHTIIFGIKTAEDGRGAASLANDAAFTPGGKYTPEKNNAKFVKDSIQSGVDEKMFIKATRDIHKGDEITVSYGQGYWRIHMPSAPNVVKTKPAALNETVAVSVAAKDMLSLILTVFYEPRLSEIESNPFFEVWVSGPTGYKSYKVVRDFSIHLAFKLPASLPTDTIIHIQAFSYITNPEDNQKRRVEAGYAEFPVQKLVFETKPLKRVALYQEPGEHSQEDLIKGSVSISALFGRTPSFYSDSFYISPDVRARAVQSLQTYNKEVREWRLSKEVAYSEIQRVYVNEYSPIFLPLPAVTYFWMRDLAAPPKELCQMLLKQVGRFRGWNEATFAHHLRNACKGPLRQMGSKKVWDRNSLEAIDAFCEVITLVCNAIPYISDFSVVHHNGKASLTIVEAFDDALRRRAGDCEDLVRVALYFFKYFLTNVGDESPLELAAHEFAALYDGYATLMSVMGAKIADAKTGPLKIQLDDESAAESVGAHMRGTLLPRKSTLPVLLIEGTGSMCATQNTFTSYLGYHPKQPNVPEFGEKWHARLRNTRESMSWRDLCNGFYRVDATHFPIKDGSPAVMPIWDGKRGISVYDMLTNYKHAKFEQAPLFTEEQMGFIGRGLEALAPAKVPKLSAAYDNERKCQYFKNTCEKRFLEEDESKWNYENTAATMVHLFGWYSEISLDDLYDVIKMINQTDDVLAAKLIFTPLDGELSTLTVVMKIKIY